MESQSSERPPVGFNKTLWIGIALAGVFIVFLAGFIPPTLRSRRTANHLQEAKEQLTQTEARLSQVEFVLEVARLRGGLGEVLHDANANNFGTAAEKATAFFDGVRAAATSEHAAAGSERRKVLDAMLARRDEISADLARADAGVQAKLAEMYLQFGAATK